MLSFRLQWLASHVVSSVRWGPHKPRPALPDLVRPDPPLPVLGILSSVWRVRRTRGKPGVLPLLRMRSENQTGTYINAIHESLHQLIRYLKITIVLCSTKHFKQHGSILHVTYSMSTR